MQTLGGLIIYGYMRLFKREMWLFVLRCGHLGCGSRRFDCILPAFFRRWGRLSTLTHMLLYSSAAIGSFEAFVFFLFLTCLRICSDTLTVEYEAGVVGCQQSCSWRFKFQIIYPKLSFFWTPFLRETDFAIYTELVRCRIAVNSFLRDHRWSRKNCSFSGRRSLDFEKIFTKSEKLTEEARAFILEEKFWKRI